jgi:tetratricopeptide (TPR) repeat protein
VRTDHPNIRIVLVCLTLAGAVLAVYWQVGRFPFVKAWDDELYVTGNPVVQRGLTPAGVVWAFTTGHAANWHPLTWLSHMLDVDLFGLNAGGHHRMNLSLHALNTVLLFLVLQGLTGAAWRSGFVAALFAVHPLHVESVAWVAERKDLLCALFWILSLWAYRRYAENRTHGWYSLVALFFLLGLLAKPMIVTLPFVLLLLDWWPLGRFEQEADGKGKRSKPDLRRMMRRLVQEKIPLFVLALASIIATSVAQGKGGALVPLRVIPIGDRLANAAVSCIRYIGKAVWPSSISFFYPHPAYSGQATPWWLALGAAALVLVLTGMAILRARRDPWLAVGWLWFLGMLVPVIGLIQVGDQAMADRYTYLPLIGLFIAVTWGVADVAKGWRFREPMAAVLAVATIAAYGAAARYQVTFWQSETALYERSLAVTHGNYLAHNNLGNILERGGRFQESETHYREAIRIDPTFAKAHNNLGLILVRQGRPDEALSHFKEALKADPNYVNAKFNMGNAILQMGRYEEALAQYRDVLRADPGNAKAHNNAGTALMNEGKVEEALIHFREAVNLEPEYAMARRNLERALLIRQSQGR